jgi:hypothetical protein
MCQISAVSCTHDKQRDRCGMSPIAPKNNGRSFRVEDRPLNYRFWRDRAKVDYGFGARRALAPPLNRPISLSPTQLMSK